MKKILKNAVLVHSHGQAVQDVYIQNGTFTEAFPESEADLVEDLSGLHLLPACIDAHVHFRDFEEAHKEDWGTASEAALVGGVGMVLDMPNNRPPIVTVAALEAKRTHIQRQAKVHFGLFFGATVDNLEEIRAAQNIVGIKLYMGSSTGELLVSDPSVWRKVFEIAREKDLPVVVHAEDEARIRERMSRFERHTEIRDCECARLAVTDALALQAEVGNRLHLAHVSCAREVELIRAHRDPRVSCEVTPHHLFFTADQMTDAFLKMNPPLRSPEDQAALWDALRDGTVTCVATDHAPHTIAEKSKPISEAPAGVPGVQWMLPLLLNAAHEGRLSLSRLVELCATAPARTFGFSKKGQIALGFDADYVVVDLNARFKITREMDLSKCAWSPYEGMELQGKVLKTVVNKT